MGKSNESTGREKWTILQTDKQVNGSTNWFIQRLTKFINFPSLPSPFHASRIYSVVQKFSIIFSPTLHFGMLKSRQTIDIQDRSCHATSSNKSKLQEISKFFKWKFSSFFTYIELSDCSTKEILRVIMVDSWLV